MSDTLISDVNDHIAMLKERDRHTFVETPAVIWNSCVTPNLRHVNPKHWMCRMLYQRQEVIFAWVTTEQLLADTLTKPLSVKRWRTFKKRLLGMTDREHLRRELILPNETKIYTVEEENADIDDDSFTGNRIVLL